MNKINILNYAAGRGAAAAALQKNNTSPCYITQGIGDAERFVLETCLHKPDTHFVVFGGDGTINEVINGIMKSGASESAIFSVIPTGTGNDFVRNHKGSHGTKKIDVIKYNDRYCINMINIGFDSNVVAETIKFKKKPLMGGSTAYILGVISVLCRKLGHYFDITYELADGTTENFEGNLLLCAIANGKFCGGGFCAAPIASLNDGLIDVLSVNPVTRRKFVSIIGDYRRGTFIDENGILIPSYEGVMTYKKCRSLCIRDVTSMCADGEVHDCSDINISVIPNAIQYSF